RSATSSPGGASRGGGGRTAGTGSTGGSKRRAARRSICIWTGGPTPNAGTSNGCGTEPEREGDWHEDLPYGKSAALGAVPLHRSRQALLQRNLRRPPEHGVDLRHVRDTALHVHRERGHVRHVGVAVLSAQPPQRPQELP